MAQYMVSLCKFNVCEFALLRAETESRLEPQAFFAQAFFARECIYSLPFSVAASNV